MTDDTAEQPLGAAEIRLEGSWIASDGAVIADDVCRRIEWLVANRLTTVATSADGWATLHRDPLDGRLWELTFPNGGWHGGGPPCLTVVSVEVARGRYQVTLPDLSSTSVGGTHPGVGERKYITIHCPSGEPGPPFEVLADDGATPLARFDTLVEAEAYAAEEATTANATVVLSPLARGYM